MLGGEEANKGTLACCLGSLSRPNPLHWNWEDLDLGELLSYSIKKKHGKGSLPALMQLSKKVNEIETHSNYSNLNEDFERKV